MPRPNSVADFWAKVEPEPMSGCWLWTGKDYGNGYGYFAINGKNHKAHRFSYEMLVGPILEETLDHLCRVRCCVNPAHLEPVSRAANTARGNPRKECCKRGHPLNGAGIRHGKMERWCRTCNAIRMRRTRAQQTEAP